MLIGKPLGRLRLIELGDPLGIMVVIKSARNELTSRLREPERFTFVACHRNGPAILDGDTKDLGAADRIYGQFVRERRRQHRSRRTPIAASGFLRRVDLGRLDRVGVRRQQRVSRVLDVVT